MKSIFPWQDLQSPVEESVEKQENETIEVSKATKLVFACHVLE